MGGNFRIVLIFVDFVDPTQTTKNSLKISADPRKITFWGLKPRIYLHAYSYAIYVAIAIHYIATYIYHSYIAVSYLSIFVARVRKVKVIYCILLVTLTRKVT